MVYPIVAGSHAVAIAVAIEGPAIAAVTIRLRSCWAEAVRRAKLLRCCGVQVELLPVMAGRALEGLQLQDLLQKASRHCKAARRRSEQGLGSTLRMAHMQAALWL